MKYKIKKIYEVEKDNYEGYKIVLQQGEKIKKLEILINNGQDCCEEFGYICSEDNFKDFIGAKILEIKTTGTKKSTKLINNPDFTKSLDEGDIMFLTLKTSKGVIQFAVYNAHNGYYGHEAQIIIDDEVVENEYL